MKKTLASIVLIASLGFSLPAHAMITPIFVTTQAPNPNRNISFSAGDSPATTGSGGVVDTTMSVAGTISNLYVNLDTAPGTGTSWTTTLYVNGSPTALTVTVSDTATSGNDISNPISVSAGDKVYWNISPSGSPANSNIHISATFEGSTAGESFLNGGGSQPSATAANYSAIFGSAQFGLNWQTTEAKAQTIVPTGFTIDQMRLYVNIGPAAGKSNVLTIYKNGTATALSATMSGTNTATDLTHSVHFSAGDTISIADVPSGSPATRSITWGFRIVPDVDGETPVYGSTPTTWTNSQATVQSILGTSFNNSTAGTVPTFFAPVALVVKKFYGLVQTAPGSGKSWAIDVRLNNTAQGAGFTIANTNTTANNTSSSVSMALGDGLDVLTTPSGSPATANNAAFAMVLYVPPAGGGGGGPPPAGPAFSQFRVLGGLLKLLGGSLHIR